MLQEFTQELKNLTGDTLRDLHTVLPGRVVSFDPSKCEASVQPYGKYKMPSGAMMDFPQLNEVPVYTMQGSAQTAVFVYPIKSGDECLLFFAEQTLETWRHGAQSNTDLRFDLSNAVAVVGMFAKPSPLVKEACDDNAVIVEKDGERVRLKKGETYIRDTAGQSVTLTPDAVTMIVNKLVVQSAGDILMTAGGNVTVNASGNGTVTTGGDITLKGATINMN